MLVPLLSDLVREQLRNFYARRVICLHYFKCKVICVVRQRFHTGFVNLHVVHTKFAALTPQVRLVLVSNCVCHLRYILIGNL